MIHHYALITSFMLWLLVPLKQVVLSLPASSSVSDHAGAAVTSGPRSTLDVNCSVVRRRIRPNSSYQFNLMSALANLTSEANTTGASFYSTIIGQSPHEAHALYLCRGDVTVQKCSICVENATQILESCIHPDRRLLHDTLYSVEGIVWQEECMVHYAKHTIPSSMENDPVSWWIISNLLNPPSSYHETLSNIINSVITKAAMNPSTPAYFATDHTFISKEIGSLYSLAQCIPDLSSLQCHECLGKAFSILQSKIQDNYGMIFLPSCQLRYQDQHFYRVRVEHPGSAPAYFEGPPSPKKRSPYIYIAIVVPAVLAAVILLLVTSFIVQKRKHKRAEQIITVESLQFDFNVIRVATGNFSNDNLLGEGGFGLVYKGKLQHGQEIAVKRLKADSQQGIEEFKTEVLLVAKLQHNNLVKLLGFCLEGNEKLLIYELLPNSSLDQYLFDPIKGATLDWKTRYKILAGIAKGLLYLHEDSRLKIVHRDLKPSNILLDEDMVPKISDFGLAKLVGPEQRNSDRIVGTQGYMAPEYIIYGNFSIQSDVYSFGVLVLEIISGQKNRLFNSDEFKENLLLRAWRLWNGGRPTMLIDSRLGGIFSVEEVNICIQIGLLCVQEDATKRPSMAIIVSALNGHPVNLPAPVTPKLPFSDIQSSTSSSNIKPTMYKWNRFSGEDDITCLSPR